VNALLDKTIGPNFAHIRNLKDVKKLKLFRNPNYSVDKEVDGEQPAVFSCPITKMELNGNHPFVAIWTTGFVLSEKAIKELGIESLQEEYGPFAFEDLVKLIPTSFEIEEQTAQMVARRNRRKSEKADKKAHKLATEGEDAPAKKRKHNEDGAAGTAAKQERTAGSTVPEPRGITSLSKSNTLVKSATEAVKAQEQQSSVFKGLFHGDKEKDKHDRDLFMSVAGIRYTLG
jgi:hypothetical protein